MSADCISLLLMVCHITVSLLSNIWPYTGLHWTIMTVNISNTNEAWGRNQAKKYTAITHMISRNPDFPHIAKIYFYCIIPQGRILTHGHSKHKA